MKFFLETSVIIRFLLGDHPTQSPKAKLIFQKAHSKEIKLVTSELVLAELTWVLKSFYKLPKVEIIRHLRNILSFLEIEIDNREIVVDAIEIFVTKNIDFTDAYFAATVKASNFEGLLSFDRDFDKILGIKRLERI